MKDKRVIERLFSKECGLEPILCVELSGNHQGKKSKLLEFIRAAHREGAEMIKFQVYTPETITLKESTEDFKIKGTDTWGKYKTLFELYEKAHTPWDWIKEGYLLCEQLKITPIASAFDKTAVDFLEKIRNSIYKIASPEITDIPLIEYIAKKGKPVIKSTGLACKEDITLAVETIKEYTNKIMILKCVSAYPTPRDEINIKSMQTMETEWRCNVGLSDHTVDDMAMMAATATGAKLIEKHFKLNGDDKSIDEHFSIGIKRIPEIKAKIRAIHECMGKDKIEISNSAEESKTGRRSIYVSKNIKKGEVFTELNLKSVRPSYGMHPKYMSDIINKKSNRDLRKGERMSKDYVMTDGDDKE